MRRDSIRINDDEDAETCALREARTHRFIQGRAAVAVRDCAGVVRVEINLGDGGGCGRVGARERVEIGRVARVADAEEAGDALVRRDVGGRCGFVRRDIERGHRDYADSDGLGNGGVSLAGRVFVSGVGAIDDVGVRRSSRIVNRLCEESVCRDQRAHKREKNLRDVCGA